MEIADACSAARDNVEPHGGNFKGRQVDGVVGDVSIPVPEHWRRPVEAERPGSHCSVPQSNGSTGRG